MGFKKFFITSLKRIGFFIGGLILWFFAFSIVFSSTPIGGQPNTIIELISFAIFIVGIIMMVYAIKLKE